MSTLHFCLVLIVFFPLQLTGLDGSIWENMGLPCFFSSLLAVSLPARSSHPLFTFDSWRVFVHECWGKIYSFLSFTLVALPAFLGASRSMREE